MATRTVYACETCQPLNKDAAALLTPTRRTALAAATPAAVCVGKWVGVGGWVTAHHTPNARHSPNAPPPSLQLFQSHCAPDHDDTTPAKLSVAQLRAALDTAGLDRRGSKSVLVARLEEYQHAVEGNGGSATPQTPGVAQASGRKRSNQQGLTVADIKTTLKALGLPTSMECYCCVPNT